MVRSGIKCDESVSEAFDKMYKGSNKAYRYIIFKIEKEGEGPNAKYKKVVVDKTGDRHLTFDDLKNDLEEEAPRYVVFDLSYHTARDNQLREKIILLNFVPETAQRKEKMVYSSTVQELNHKLGSAAISASLFYDSKSEIKESEIVEDMAKKN